MTDTVTQEDGSASGLLARDHEDGFVPSLVDANPAEAGGQLLQLAYQPASAWPLRDTAAHRAVIAYIAKAIGLTVADPNERYTNLSQPFGGALYNKLAGLTSDATDFALIKDELKDEFDSVEKVRGYFAQIRTILTESVILNRGELDKFTGEVGIGIPVPGDPSVKVNAFTIYADLFNVAKGLGVPGAGVIAGAIKVAGALTNKKGQDILGDFTSAFNQLGQDLVLRYKESLSAVALTQDIVLTDYGKLRAADANITAERPGWMWTGTTIAQTRLALAFSARRLFAEALLPTAYTTYRLPGDFQDAKSCRIVNGEPDSAWVPHVNSVEWNRDHTGVDPQTQAYAIGKTSIDDRTGESKANASLTDPLFQRVSVDHPDQLGLSKIAFIEKVLPQKSLSSIYCHRK